MSDVKKAAFEWLRTLTITDYGTMDREGSLTFENAFLAGAAWQREQDAKLCRSLRDSGNPSTWVAETCARTIESKQEAKPDWCVCDDKHVCMGHADCQVSSNQDNAVCPKRSPHGGHFEAAAFPGECFYCSKKMRAHEDNDAKA